ncbi:DUF1365 family protein [Brevundimonas sp.]|uniref:DUF1365 domain-containing protein n=1 Tax=Brevundimonas sp. TaxID=1871086 RepID=UPI00286B0002|nr:DUF1365 family protein [Brevundimonas sp.]
MSTGLRSGIYTGPVFHRRLRPRVHALRYRLFMLLIDLDEWDDLVGRLRWLGAGRFGLMTLRQSDHGDGSEIPLKVQIEQRLGDAGIPTGGRVQLLTLPRILGYGFNPLSVYYCHARNGRLSAVLYEVSNTFGGRHSYLMPVGAASGPVRQAIGKAFHVSPFMDMDLTYRFEIDPPAGVADEITRVSITVDDADGPMLLTGFSGVRSGMTDANLRRAWLGHPLLTLKVIAGIHWEAIRLLLKGLRLRGGVTPAHSVTVGGPSETSTGARHA